MISTITPPLSGDYEREIGDGRCRRSFDRRTKSLAGPETVEIEGTDCTENTVFCDCIVSCMPSITDNVDDDLKERMEEHPE
jgi:hypothetical protein